MKTEIKNFGRWQKNLGRWVKVKQTNKFFIQALFIHCGNSAVKTTCHEIKLTSENECLGNSFSILAGGKIFSCKCLILNLL